MKSKFTFGCIGIIMLLLLTTNFTYAQEGDKVKSGVQSLNDTYITLNLTNVTPIQFFKEIQKQTNFYFVYNSEDMAKIKLITCNVTSKKLKDVLDSVLGEHNLTYEFSDERVIVVKPATVKAKPTDAKSRKINGFVFFDNKPLENAYVTLKGTNNRTITNTDGEWSLYIPQGQESNLEFTYVGLENADLKILANELTATFLTTMFSNSILVDDVIVTGFERVDKRKSTGSVATIMGDRVLEPIGMTADKMLQGKLAGVSITQNSSTPGATPKIRIRGNSTILGNREPIWVVDGIIMEAPVKVSAADLNSMDRINLVGNAISFLNPNDIERIDVLKDVSATAIYGVKAANGVVVVTTKRGKSGRLSVTYNGNVSVKDRPSYNRLNLMNSSERVDVSEEIARRGLSFTGITRPKVGYEGLLSDLWDRKISYTEFNNGVYDLRSANTDWYDELLRNAVSHSHNVSISGGGDKATYYISGSYAKETDAQLNTGLSRFTISSNLNFNLRENLSLNVGFSAAQTNTERTHSSIDLSSYAYNTSRVLKARNNDGSLAYYPMENSMLTDYSTIDYNIFNEMEHTGYDEENSAININLNLNYKILPWLTSNTVFGYSTTSSVSDEFADDQSYYITEMRGVPYGMMIPDEVKAQTRLPFGGILDQRNNQNNTYNIRESVMFNKRVRGEDFIDAQVGVEIRGNEYKGTQNREYGYFHDRGKQVIIADFNEYTAYANIMKDNRPYYQDNISNTMSLFGILRYSFEDRYSANFNVRYDGSNKFGRTRENRFLPVWSIAGRWNLHNESFMKGVEFLDEFGIKASYGLQGNVLDGQTPNMIISSGTFDPVTQEYYSNLISLPNPNLRWEKTTSYQIGVDFSILRGLMSGTFEYYDKVGHDQIVSRTVEGTNGVENVIINAGKVYNKGWELGVNFNLIRRKNWDWSLSANISKNVNKIVDTENPKNTNFSDYVSGSLLVNGESINSFYSYKFAGLDPNSGLPTFGGLDFYNEDGSQRITSLEDAFASVFAYSGRRDPLFSGGFNTRVAYKNLSLNANFAFALGHKIRLNSLFKDSGQQLPLPDQNWTKDFVNRWQRPGDLTNIPVLSDQVLDVQSVSPHAIGNNFWQMYNQSDLRVVSGNYLRCTSASVNYNFGENVARKIGASALSCSLVCNNLFVIANSALNGQDPEQVNGTRTIPPQRTFSLTLNVNF